MTLPRSAQINPAVTPYYHCVSRCVRRAFLCGKDTSTGRDFSHRRRWIEHRLHALSGVFAIDLCAYAVMSNHYHVVLHVDSAALKTLTADEVVERWTTLYKLPTGFRALSACARQALIKTWRDRLGSVSWYMRSINEALARWANREDRCTGRFWEGRFRSQALLDSDALLKCMVYVDLNPVRAGIAATLKDSMHTSIRARVLGRCQNLAPLRVGTNTRETILPVGRAEYLHLVETTGQHLQHGKKGSIDSSSPTSVQQVTREWQTWLSDIANLARRYSRAIGTTSSLHAYKQFLGQKRLRGLRHSTAAEGKLDHCQYFIAT